MAMDIDTGKAISGAAEIEQSINGILATIPGDRYMRAEYGSGLFELVDVGMDASGKARLAQAVGESLRRFEPRVKITKVAFEGTPGELVQTVYGTIRTTNEQIILRR